MGSKSEQKSESKNESVSIGIGGDNLGLIVNGNGNSITQTDFGAIEAAGDIAIGAFDSVNNANDNLSYIASDGLSLAESVSENSIALADSVSANSMALADSLGNAGINAGVELAQDGFMFANDAINTNSALVSQYGDLSALMLDRTLSSNESAFSQVGELLDSQGERNLNAALAVGEAGYQQLMLGTDLARDLSEQSSEASFEMQKNNNSTLENGFKSMMQFADSVSRSDGSKIAESTNKTVMALAGAGAVVYFISKKWA